MLGYNITQPLPCKQALLLDMDKPHTKGGTRVRGSFVTHSLVLLQLTLLAIQKGKLPCMLPNLYPVVTTKKRNGHLSSIASTYILLLTCFKLILESFDWKSNTRTFSFNMALSSWFCNDLQKLHTCTVYTLNMIVSHSHYRFSVTVYDLQLPNKLNTTFSECIIVLFAFSSREPLSYCVVYTLWLCFLAQLY